MAVITLAGVGYGEIVETAHNPLLRIFNMGVVLVGVAVTVYVFSVVAAFLVEIEVSQPFLEAQNAETNQTRSTDTTLSAALAIPAGMQSRSYIAPGRLTW